MKHVVVLTIDRLGAGYLGPYGNTWIETPAFNRLASRSLLCETAIAESPDLATALRSYWTGRHAANHGAIDPMHSLPENLNASGCQTTLLSDDADVLEHPLAAAFGERIPVDAPEPKSAAGDVSETGMAQLFAVACERAASLAGPSLLWIHSRGMGGPWDAPYSLRNQFADEDDPSPPSFVLPPSRELPKSFDPDELLGCQHAYAGQIVLTDLCLGALLDALDSSAAAAETLLIVTSPRGFPLGEHGAIGSCGDRLFGEVLHVPLMVRLPGDQAASRRSHALVQPADLYATLAAWLGITAADENLFGRDLLSQLDGDGRAFRQAACSVSVESEHAIRTPAWFLRRDSERLQLYVKPDDRWEVNEISDRCGEIAEQLSAALDAHLAALEVGVRELEPLAPVLLEGLD